MRDIYKILDALLVPAKVCIRKEIIWILIVFD